MQIFLCPWTDAVGEELFESFRDDRIYRYLNECAPLSAAAFCQRHGPERANIKVHSVHLESKKGPAIGLVSVGMESMHECTIGFMLGRKHWGCGYAKQMIEAAIDEVSLNPTLRCIRAEVDDRNCASLHALKSCGFLEIDRLEAMLKREATTDVVLRLCLPPKADGDLHNVISVVEDSPKISRQSSP